MENVQCTEWVPATLKLLDRVLPGLCFFMMVGTVPVVLAEESCNTPVARMVSLQGVVEYYRSEDSGWYPADSDSTFCVGDRVRVRANSRAALRLSNESMLRLDQRTAITIEGPDTEQNTLLDLMNGVMHIITRTPKPFKIRTPVVNASVDGTEFLVDASGEDDPSPKVTIAVYEGRVNAGNGQDDLILTNQETAVFQENQPARKAAMVHPLDAVQWALHYPVLINLHSRTDRESQQSPAVRRAIEQYRRGRLIEALAELDHLPVEELTADILILRSELLLTAGRVEEALSDLQQAEQLEPGSSDALALRATIFVAKNRKQEALELAEQAVKSNPASSAAKLALSYAQQAHFQIESALTSAEEAVRLDSMNALTWARLSELQMAAGKSDYALPSAERAVRLDPNLSRTQTVLGFAYLLQIDTRWARAAFARAIMLDQADPMPRLGMGIAWIRENKLEVGRIDIETAASLDPANSLIRSYLGKAYFEEKRYPLATTQFDLAKVRDPNDPTPWLYDAIQKQTQNRPVEALRDVQKSIELNDNRAVYRSQLLLDQDQAARGSSLARIYDNLGFEQRALMETAKSLSFDPASHSAHRFLSDAYAHIPRHEIARVSELLQAQLLQPVNVNPVQPRMAVADLNIITGTGPSTPGFNEFTPLMERNKAQLVASGVVGNHGTLGDEVVVSGVYDRASVSVGQFHYQTDGFRPNNDQTHNIYNAFMQYAVTPDLNVQAELRRREKKHGDLLMDFDPKKFSRTARRNLEEDTARLGAMYRISPRQNFLLSSIYTHRDTDIEDLAFGFPLFGNQSSHGYQVEAQHIFRKDRVNIITGGGIYRTNLTDDFRKNTEPLICMMTGCEKSKADREQNVAYLYSNLNILKNATATLGFSYHTYSDDTGGINRKISEVDPKIGLQMDFHKNIRLRMAWFEALKRDLIGQATIEPTQIAGFNQFYDEISGTKSRHKAVGLDIYFTNAVYGGVEVSERNLDVPVVPEFSAPGGEDYYWDRQREQLFRGYVYGTPRPNWAFAIEPEYEKFDRRERYINQPVNIHTLRTPVSISYFDQNGFWAKLTGTYVMQDVKWRRFDEDIRLDWIEKKDSNFFLLDMTAGYRLPRRRGLLSFEVRNLLNKHFYYRNQYLYLSEPALPRYIPERTFFARVTLNF
ncbi:FecR domain-containing protein [Nitrosomonas sp.]|uniref:FecR domain-containing protein n=1 Tax=Nitrosomonas sp. TaxID=42353 RepID=UPI003305E782